MKKWMMGVLTFLFLCSGLSSQVFAAAPVRDNDDPSGDTWNSGTWTYEKASSGFRGDYRYRTSNSTSAEYGWVLPTNNSPKVIYVYLNANLASNTRADYWVGGKHFAYVNQKKALGGWNKVRKGATSAAVATLAKNSLGMDIAVMATGNGHTVADGIRLDN